MNALLPKPVLPAVAGLALGFVLALLSAPLGWLLSVDADAVLTLGIRLAAYGPLLSLLWLSFGGLVALLVAVLS